MVSGTRGKEVWWLKISCQECRVQITLDRTNPAGTLMPALREEFLGVRLAAVTVLRQFGAARGKLVQGAASVCNCASQVVYQHPWSTHAHALAELLLPASISNLFDTDIVADTDNLVYNPPMQAFAMAAELAFVVCQSSPRGKVPLAILPGEASLTMLLDAPFLIVVLRVIGTKLSVQLAL